MLAEESLQLRVGNLRDRGRWHYGGQIEWKRSNTAASFNVLAHRDEATVFLTVQRDGKSAKQTISCVTTKQRIGLRWWFMCPRCGRRMGVLYLPPGKTKFACRKCYAVSYRSQLHDLDFILVPMATAAGVPKRIARSFLQHIGTLAAAGHR